MYMKRGIIFDLDGTLWDSSDTVVDSWNVVLQKAPEETKPCTIEWMQRLMGKTVVELEEAFLGYLPEERRHELMAECLTFEVGYVEEHGGKLMPGVREALAILKKDYHLSIVSNCQKGYVPAFFKSMNMEEFFDDYEENGRTGLVKADNIRLVIERNHLGEAIYVGDTMQDYNSSVQAKVPFIHAAYGYGQVPDGTPKIDSILELPKEAAEIFKKG